MQISFKKHPQLAYRKRFIYIIVYGITAVNIYTYFNEWVLKNGHIFLKKMFQS